MIRRYNAHINRSYKNKYHSSQWVQSLIKIDLKPIIEVIEECDEDNWVEREIYWIAYYRQLFDLTNILDGGNGGSKYGRLGKPWSEEQRKNNRKARLGKSVNHTEEGNKKRADGIRNYYDKNKKKVYQFDMDGNLIKEWDSAKSASNELNLNISNIHNICKGLGKHCGGFIWSYTETPPNFIQSNNEYNKKAVIQLDVNGEILNEFNSITEASKITKISSTAISNNLKNKSNSAGGYKWKYKH